ncbi:MAG: hypothetical protein M1827_007513 [Pycnora praestabilis]|nr:MAG: hypothetical protein M1827_007513 [Pycnora praestabilis]
MLQQATAHPLQQELQKPKFKVRVHIVRISSSQSLKPLSPYIPGACPYLLLTIPPPYRLYDNPSYTLQTFISPSSLDAYLSIRAFNIDIARVADSTSNPTIASMRMQFWRDTINKSFAGTPPKEPVGVLLSHALSVLSSRTAGKARLHKSWFMRVIAAREQYLHNAPYPTLEALELYAENTYSTLSYLTLASLPLTSVTADHLASHIGKAAGIAAVLRGIPLLAFPPPPNHHSNTAALGGVLGSPSGGGSGRQGAVTLPLDVMAEVGVKEEEVLKKGAEAQGLTDAVFAVATRANDHLITAREMLKNLRAGEDVGHEFEHPGEVEGHDYTANSQEQTNGKSTKVQNEEVERAFGVLMQAIPTSLWLERLQKADFDIFKPELRKREWRLPYKAYWAYSRRRI